MRKRNREAIFGGGGVKGFCHIGFLHGVRKLNVKIDRALGVSVGSLIAALHMNNNDADAIHRIFADRLRKSITKAAMNFDPNVSAVQLMSEVLGYRPRLLREAFTATGAPGFDEVNFDADPVKARAELIELSAWYPDLMPMMQETVKDLGLKPVKGLRILAFDVITRKPVVFSGTDYDLATALTASCALPGAFRPVPHPNGKGLLIDGAWYHRNPADLSKPGAIISKLGQATAMPLDTLTYVELMGHMKEMMGLSAWHQHEVDPCSGQIVVEMATPHVAGLSFGISTATQNAMVEYGEANTINVLTAAMKNGKF